MHGESGDLGWMNAWAGKLAGQIARIAAIFQLAEHGPSDVGIESMQRALALAPYFEAHAAAALASGGSRQALTDARKLLGWLMRERPVTYLEREAYRRNFGQDTKRSSEAHELLADHGWIRNAEPERHDSTRWETHPQIGRVSAVSVFSGRSEISHSDLPPLSTVTAPLGQITGMGTRPPESTSRTTRRIRFQRKR